MMTFLRENWIFLLLLGLMIVTGVVAYVMRHRYAIIGELFQFLRERKLWWLLPIIIILLVVSILILMGTYSAAFIYPLF